MARIFPITFPLFLLQVELSIDTVSYGENTVFLPVRKLRPMLKPNASVYRLIITQRCNFKQKTYLSADI